MSLQSELLAKVTAVLTKMNLWETNAKKTEELEEMEEVDASSLVRVSVGGVSKKLELQKLISASTSTTENTITSIGEISFLDNDLTIPYCQWLISGVSYLKLSPTVIEVLFAETGKTRIDIVVANTMNELYLVSGFETTGVAVRPNIPINTILVTQLVVTDSVIESIVVPTETTLTSEQLQAIQSSSTPSSSNPFATNNDLQEIADILTSQGLNTLNYSFEAKNTLEDTDILISLAGLEMVKTSWFNVWDNFLKFKAQSLLTTDFLGSAQPTDTPTGTGASYWLVTEPGTYTNFGGVVVDANSLAVISRDAAGAFTISQSAIVLDSYAQKNEVFDYIIGKNKFNKLDVINGFYINTVGALAANAPSITSNWIPVDPSKTYYVSGRGSTTTRFKNASETIIPPVNSSGTNIAYSATPSTGIIYIPPTATHIQFTCVLSSGNADLVQFEEGTAGTSYENYTVTTKVKNTLIPELGEAQINIENMQEEAENLNSELFQFIIGKNKFNKLEVINGFFISSVNGSLSANAPSKISPWIPIDASKNYYLSGRTTSGMRFRNSAGTLLQPFNSSGVAVTNWSSPSGSNGVVYPPTGAIEVQFATTLSGDGSIDNVQFEEGTNGTSYENYIVTKKITSSLIPEIITEQTELYKVNRSTDLIQFRTHFNAIYDIVFKITSGGYNGLYNLSEAKLVLKAQDDSVIGISLNGVGTDDSAPSFFNNTIVGGNHGGPAYLITATAHGKTLADVGAVYTDVNSKQFVILKIDSANTFSVGVKNTSLTETWTFPAPVTPLIYTSNGNSTSIVNFSSSVGFQLYPSIKNKAQKIMLDNTLIEDLGVHYGDKINVVETYDIIDYPDMLTKLTANRPGGGYLTQPTFTNGDAIISVTNIFNIQPKGTVSIVNSWSIEKTIYLDRFFGITQNGYVTPSWATTCRRYFPKTLPITNNGNTFDFRMKPEFKTPVITGYIGITSAFWEGGKPVNRVVDMLESSGLNVNFNLGYLPLGGNRADLVNNAWEMTSTKKLYPRFVDGKIGVSNVVTAGTVVQGVAFRGWSQPAGIRTNELLVENGGKNYLFLDFHSVGTDIIELPSYLLGKQVSVIDKSANVTLVTSIVTGFIKVKVETASPLYGYCELLIQ